jgi:hypothetical protein
VKIYWDTSAAINAAISPEVFSRLDNGEHVTRLHLLAEFFAIMTGRGIEIADAQGNPVRMVLSQDDCAAWLRGFSGKVRFDELTRDEILDALDNAQNRGIQGAQVYDYWHVLVAQKAQADEIITRNTKHFKPLTQAAGIRAAVEWP